MINQNLAFLDKTAELYKNSFISNIPQNVHINSDMRIPRNFVGSTFSQLEGYENKIKQGKNSVIEKKCGLYIYGRCGAGKTHFAISLMYEWVKSNTYFEIFANKPQHTFPKGLPLFVAVDDFCREIEEQYKNRSTESEICNKYSRAPLLVIDDLFTVKNKERSQEAIIYLISKAYKNGQQIIITADHILEDVAEHIDERVASRMLEMCCLIHLDGEDYRLKKHAKNMDGLSSCAG